MLKGGFNMQRAGLGRKGGVDLAAAASSQRQRQRRGAARRLRLAAKASKEGSKSAASGDQQQEGKRLVPLSGVEDGRYADVDLESLRKALLSTAGERERGNGPDYSSVQRNLALELVRVTEAAALEAGRWFGRGKKNDADDAAVKAMRKVLNALEIDGVVVIGEGVKDDAPMLFCGERVGAGYGQEVDVAVDPLDGTTLVSKGAPGSISVIATAERGSLLDCGPCVYMEKIVCGSDVGAGVVDLNQPLVVNLAALSKRLNKPVTSLTVAVLDRPRHEDIVRQCRQAGTRIRLFADGDVAMSLEAARAGSAVDLMVGIGGSPEGVLSACALKCMGGFMQGRLAPRNEEEKQTASDLGLDMGILTIDDIVTGKEVYFAATGISDGLLKGVQYVSGGAVTNSLVMRSESGTIRTMETHHHWHRPGLTNIDMA